MTQLKEKYIVDEEGKKTAVVLNIKEFNKLLEEIEDYKDRLDLEKAQREAKGFTLLEDFIAELKKEGRLTHYRGCR